MKRTTLTERIVITGELELLSPLQIGSGQNDFIDLEILRDFDDKPYIPGTSLSGVLRHLCFQKLHKWSKELNDFWGYTKENLSSTSKIIFNDALLMCKEFTIEIRENVSIDPKTKVAKQASLYNSELVSAGVKFSFNCELEIHEKHLADLHKKFLYSVIQFLQSGNFFIGAKSNSGHGNCRLVNVTAFCFNYTEIEDVKRWLAHDFSKPTFTSSDISNMETFKLSEKRFYIRAKFEVKNSILIRSYTTEEDKPDAVHISSGKNKIIPGSSLKGVLRHRIERISETLGLNKRNELKNLFGYVDRDGKIARKGKLRVFDSKLTGLVPKKQSRIKIDRFTGGVIEGALFDEEPLWNASQGKANCTVRLEVDYDENTKNFLVLILLAIKDMWSEDLTIGGEASIGRGRLIGHSLEITLDGKTTKITKNGSSALVFSSEDTIREFNEMLVDLIEEGRK